MATYASYVLNERPVGRPGLPVPGRTFRKETRLVPTEADLKEGQIIFEAYALSIDPAMLGWMQDTPSYLPPVGLGEPMRGYLSGKVVASKSALFKPGEVVATLAAGWNEYSIVSDTDLYKTAPGARMTDIVGLYGTTGLTAYFGLEKIAKPKAGELAVVSAAAGATGSVVGQILKLKGCKVIGIAGGEEKAKWLTEKMGFDVCLDYKAPDFKEKFVEATKDGIDIYWDNVRGDVLDLVFAQASVHARFVCCGNMSQRGRQDGEQAYKNLGHIIPKRILMQGFLLIDWLTELPSAVSQMATWYAEGKLWTDDTIVKGGFEAAEGLMIDLYNGKNRGKMVLEIKSSDA